MIDTKQLNQTFDNVQVRRSLDLNKYNMYFLDDRYNSIVKIAKLREIHNKQEIVFETINGYRLIMNIDQQNNTSSFYLKVLFKKIFKEFYKTNKLKVKIKKTLINIIGNW